MKALSALHERLIVKSADRDGTPRAAEFLDNDSIRPTRVKTEPGPMLHTLPSGSRQRPIRAGALYRIPFPVLCRSSWGPVGALWPTVNRAVMAIVWNGVNAVQGAQCLQYVNRINLLQFNVAANGDYFSVLLRATFPSMANTSNKMGDKSVLISAGMICFFGFWFVNCAFLFVPIPKMRILVYIKVAVYYSATIAMLAWALSLSGNFKHALRSHSTIHGAEKSWMIAKFFWLGLASVATFVSNAADLQRYTERPNDVILGQVFSFLIANFIIAIKVCVIAATSEAIFGKPVWNPIHILAGLMEGYRYTPGNRAGCFFISLGFVYSTIFTNIFENSIPVGNDIVTLLPKYLNAKRAIFICAGKQPSFDKFIPVHHHRLITHAQRLLLRYLPMVPAIISSCLHKIPLLLPDIPLPSRAFYSATTI
ncbi:hypothetical protein BBP40_000373 [Aspergillus hancockii]|nr:hypothetical protein BBP40_000373 [Aspergillus hancockii]